MPREGRSQAFQILRVSRGPGPQPGVLPVQDILDDGATKLRESGEGKSVAGSEQRPGWAYHGCEGMRGSQERAQEKMNAASLGSSVWKPSRRLTGDNEHIAQTGWCKGQETRLGSAVSCQSPFLHTCTATRQWDPSQAWTCRAVAEGPHWVKDTSLPSS